MKRIFTLLFVGFLILTCAGCKTLNNVDQAIGRNQVRIKKFFAKLFLAETESVHFAVRIRHEFFVYFPPVNESADGFQELSDKIKENLAVSQLDTVLDKDLEHQAQKHGTSDINYLETKNYRVFIEPRLISFEYRDGIPPVSAILDKGNYALSMQSQIIIRDKNTGQEVWRHTVDAINDLTYRTLIEFGNKKDFDYDLKHLAMKTSEKILFILKDQKPFESSGNRLVAFK
ncbi:MAG: hypothetical protein KAI43_08055 [Candidatus Aureabacteria bacterium]|nr:hypothetical protein [Candidatus Auribacterota bacterium]